MQGQYKKRTWLRQLLEENLARSTGCTEPAAIAYAAALAAGHCRGHVEKIRLLLSSNIYKNAAAVKIPGTSLAGPAYAAALGFLFGQPSDGLAVFSGLDQKKAQAARVLVESGAVEIRIKSGEEAVYISFTAICQENTVKVVSQGSHLGVRLLEVDGQARPLSGQDFPAAATRSESMDWMDVALADLYDFACHYPLDELGLLDESMVLCRNLAREGLAGDYGLNVGRTAWAGNRNSRPGKSVLLAAWTAAACDARMAGAQAAVIANSGSGNQGIAAVMPLLAAAEERATSWLDLRRAVALSHLVTIYIKHKTGSLSSLCGALAAATGASCGLVMLWGGGLTEIGRAIQNSLANLAGIICDGAKASCALKLYSCTGAACLAAELAMAGINVQATDGFIEADPALTVHNYGSFARACSRQNDQLILQLMGAGPDKIGWD